MEIDSVHFYVNNANQTSLWFVNHLGFLVVDRYQDEHNLTIAVACTSVLLVISSPLNHQSEVTTYLDSHAEGIVDVAFRLADLPTLVQNQQGLFKAAGLQNLRVLEIAPETQILYGVIAGWGDNLRHTLLTTKLVRRCYSLPDGTLRIIPEDQQKQRQIKHKKDPLKLSSIDHVVLNVAQGSLQSAVDYYQALFAWQIQQTFKISTQHSGLASKALIDATGRVQFNINEPTTANSQIQEFLDLNHGSGIQHLALRSLDLTRDVAKMRIGGVNFLPIPNTYYQKLEQEFSGLKSRFADLDLLSIAEQAILVDWQKNNTEDLLLQIFTQPMLAQPTFFLEFIERRCHAKGFGAGNFHALFAAVEAEQAKLKPAT